MVRASALVLLLLASCNNELHDARQRQLTMIANHAPWADLCADSKRNADMALRQKDDAEYRFWLDAQKEECKLAARQN